MTEITINRDGMIYIYQRHISGIRYEDDVLSNHNPNPIPKPNRNPGTGELSRLGAKVPAFIQADPPFCI